MRPPIDLNMLVLSAVWAADTDGAPMTAGELAFLLDVLPEETELSLEALAEDGSIRLDGERYRLRRPLTQAELDRMDELSDRLQQLCPMVDDIHVKLDS
jgi:hypothetical protein